MTQRTRQEKSLKDLQDAVVDFNRARGWLGQEYTPQTLAMLISGEAAELLEIFAWDTTEGSWRIREDAGRLLELQREMADVLIYLLCLAQQAGVNLQEAVEEKLAFNAGRCPIPEPERRA